MKTAELVKLELKVPKSKVRKIKTLLEKEGVIAEVSAPELPKAAAVAGMRKGNHKKGEKPSQFAGVWEKREESYRAANREELRRKAWGNRGVH